MSDCWQYQQYFLTSELTAHVTPKNKYWVNTFHFFNVFSLYFVINVYYTLIRVVTSFIRFSEKAVIDCCLNMCNLTLFHYIFVAFSVRGIAFVLAGFSVCLYEI